MALGQLALYLFEGTAETRKSVAGNADAGIGDGKNDAVAGRPPANHDPAACRRKFDGIGQQVERDLLKCAAIGSQFQLRRYSRGDLQCLVFSACGNDAHCVVKQRIKTDIVEIEPKPACLDLRHVEDIVDDLEQILSAATNIAAILIILFRPERAEHSGLHDFGKADDCVQRGAQLVTHIGKEF